MDVDYDSDEVIAEITDEMYAREHKQKASMFAGCDKKVRTWMGVFAAIVFYCIFTERITNVTGMKILAAGIIIIYFISVGDTTKRAELSYVQCMIRIDETLKMLQKHKIGDMEQIPPGKIGVKLVGRKQWYEGNAFKRSFRVDLQDRFKDIVKIYFVEVDVFTGDIITFREAPEGVRGDETKDIKIMANFDMMVQKKRDQYMDKSYKV